MKKTVLSLSLVLSFGISTSVAFAIQPNRQATPGKLCTPSDPNFREFRYPAHIAYCNRNVSHSEKLKVAEVYGVPESDWQSYEFDHLIPLNAGGSDDAENIWPQPLAEAHLKDVIEQQTYDGLSSGTITQDQAVKMIWDWIDQH
jgi:hypothetical protein